MSLKTIFLLLGAPAGYCDRLFPPHDHLLGKRGSMELEIRKMMLDAEEKAKKITEEAEANAKENEEQIAAESKEREGELKQVEERLVRKEELLDKRQTNLDTETRRHAKSEEVQIAKEKAEKMMRAAGKSSKRSPIFPQRRPKTNS